MDDELQRLRREIDHVDESLIELLARRASLTRQVGDVKRDLGRPLVDPTREAELFRARRERARQRGVAPALIEDVLRRTIRDSYAAQEERFGSTGPLDRPVVIVGGSGAFGRCLGGFFRRSGYRVREIERADWNDAATICERASAVIVSVPIDRTVEVIGRLPALPDDCVLADVTSVKQAPLAAMLERHPGPVVGLHPMFGPDVRSLAKQVVVVCPGRASGNGRWLLDQFVLWGATLREETPRDHDRAMATIQAMRHFSTTVYGAFLERTGADLDELLRLSSPIYRLELAMVGRLFAQNPELYADIMLSARELGELAETYREAFDELHAHVREGRREEIVAFFERARSWFGPRAEDLLHESGDLLRKAHDARDPQA